MKTKRGKSAVKAATRRAVVAPRRKRAHQGRASQRRALKPRRKPRASSGISSLWLYGVAAAPAIIALILWRLYVPTSLPEPVEPIPTSKQATTQEKTAREVLASEFSQAATKDIAARAVYWSERMWMSPDVRKRIARIEGAPTIQDSVPLVPDTYDCTTFMETVSALARSKKEADFFKNLLAIRYNGPGASFKSRNHFPEADWIANNVKAGILSQITEDIARIGGVPVGVEKKMIDRAKWLETMVRQGKVSRELASATGGDAWAVPQEASVSYVAMSDFDRVESHVPDGAIVNLVRKNDDKRPVLITHQGFALRTGGVLMLRHVTPKGKIRTVRMSEYLKALHAKDQPTWPILGVNFNRLNDG